MHFGKNIALKCYARFRIVIPKAGGARRVYHNVEG